MGLQVFNSEGVVCLGKGVIAVGNYPAQCVDRLIVAGTAAVIEMLPGSSIWLADGLSEAMVRFAARHEYARTVEDVLARRSRLLFLDARLAAKLAPRVADILREELGADPALEPFLALAQQYVGKKQA